MGRALLILVGLVAAGWYLLANPVARTAYSCEGELTSAGISQSRTIYLIIEQYRWWFIWANDDGEYVIADPNGDEDQYTGLLKSGYTWYLYKGLTTSGIPDGRFSTLSNLLQFKLYGDYVFLGACTQKD